MQFGDRLRELREDKGLSQKELAQALSLSPSTIGKSLAFDRNNEEECMRAIRKGLREAIINGDGTVDINLIQFGE